MNTDPLAAIFLSHATENDSFVHDLRLRLEQRGYPVLEDSTTIRPADDLPATVKSLIDRAGHVVAAVSADAAQSDWVRREVRYARKLAQQRAGFRVIPLQLPGASDQELRAILELPDPEPDADLEELPHELLAIKVATGTGAMDALMPSLIDALEGRIAPGQIVPAETPRAITELADLVLRLSNPRFEIIKDKRGADVRRPVADATLAFYPPGAAEPAAVSPEFKLAAPLGTIEGDDLSFYLERYHITPFGVFANRANAIEGRLPEWGKDLWQALRPEVTGHATVIGAWEELASTAHRRLTIQSPQPEDIPPAADAATVKACTERAEATTELLALPWELIHDGHSYLFDDGLGVRVRRCLPSRRKHARVDPEMHKPPLRVLIVCARPEGDCVAYIDHRVSVRPLTEALNALGGLASYEILDPPTFPALKAKLREALNHKRPYHIVHFDGHGVYDRVHGLGKLVFEHPDSVREGKLTSRQEQLLDAVTLGGELRNKGVGLFFLEACESAVSTEKPEASVAGRLLQSGIASVAAMSHSVLVETARRFTEVFYPALVSGERVGAAMLKGQRHLYDERRRGWGWEPRGDSPGKVDRRPLELQDWFVPVLYQDGEDPVLLTENPPAERVREEIRKDRTLALGALPEPPEHTFVGRSRELLAAERLLIEQGQRYVVLRGEGGEGKTELSVELSRWLVSTRRMDRAAFASVETLADPRAVLWAWGEQLVPGFASRAGDSLDSAEGLVVHTLSERKTVLVLDNVESILPPPEDSEAAGARVFDQETLDAILGLCSRLLEKAAGTRIVFTSREALPAGCGFDGARNRLEIGRLSVREGMELVARVLALAGSQRGVVSAEALQAEREEEIRTLVETVNGHARSLVLLTPELARRGLAATTEELIEIMADLEERYPGERKRSLFASVELSLRRLPREVRARLARLCVFQGGGNVRCIAQVLGIHARGLGHGGRAFWPEYLAIGTTLEGVGLAEILPPEGLPYVRFDPALAPALRRDLLAGGEGNRADEAGARALCAYAYCELAHFLEWERLRSPGLAAHLTVLELPNLLAALRLYAEGMDTYYVAAPLQDEHVGLRLTGPLVAVDDATPEMVIEFATTLEGLLQDLDRREVIAQISVIREHAQRIQAETRDGRLTETGFSIALGQIKRLLNDKRYREATAAAQALVKKTETAGDAGNDVDYDLALAQRNLGVALRSGDLPEAALEPLAAARLRFESLAETRQSDNAAAMASACLTDEGDCLTDLGQIDAAAAKYQAAIEIAEGLDAPRQVAISRFQLGKVRLLQNRYEDAIQIFQQARATFEVLGEPRNVTVSWYQIGTVHAEAGKLEQAESAYQKSLAMNVQAGNKLGEAATRNQLGCLYHRMEGRQRDAVLFFRQAAEIYADPATVGPLGEGRARSNAANTLVALGRFGEARAELTRALECQRGFGPNAQRWKAWNILCNLETAEGNPTAAAAARRHAMAEYEKARRQGWQIAVGSGMELCHNVSMIATSYRLGEQIPADLRVHIPRIEAGLRQQLKGYVGHPRAPAYLQALALKLLAILDGSRDPALAADPALDYDDAVELKLLLEQLGG